MLNAPLLADGIWGWIVPILVITVYVISHLWNVIQGQQPQQQRPNQQRRPRGPQGERPLPDQPQQPAGQSHLNAEIEQFLKRANERREQKSRRAAPQKESTPVPPQRQFDQSAAVEIEPIERTDFDSVSSSVERHLGLRSFEKRDEILGEDIDQADEEMELHLQQAFGHRVGTFDTSTSRDSESSQRDNLRPSPTDDHPATALALAGLLVNQASLRQAVLLKEILERPVDRW